MQRECPSFYNGGRVEAKLQGRQLNKKRNKSAGDFPVFVRTPAVLAPVLFLLRPPLPPPPPSSSHLGARLRTPARFQKSHPCPIAVEQTFFFPPPGRASCSSADPAALRPWFPFLSRRTIYSYCCRCRHRRRRSLVVAFRKCSKPLPPPPGPVTRARHSS